MRREAYHARRGVDGACPIQVEQGNLANLGLARDLLDRGAQVVVADGPPIGQRDFTGGDAAPVWSYLRARAEAIVANGEPLASTLQRLLPKLSPQR
jgi:hypothetical protein